LAAGLADLAAVFFAEALALPFRRCFCRCFALGTRLGFALGGRLLGALYRHGLARRGQQIFSGQAIALGHVGPAGAPCLLGQDPIHHLFALRSAQHTAMQRRLQLIRIGVGHALLRQCALRELERQAHFAVTRRSGRWFFAGRTLSSRRAAAAQGGDQLIRIVAVADPATELGDQPLCGSCVVEGGCHALGKHQCGVATAQAMATTVARTPRRSHTGLQI